MKFNFSNLFPLFCLLAFTSACKTQKPTSDIGSGTEIKTNTETPRADLPEKNLSDIPLELQPLDFELAELPREFRGVWIATVVNIDWPTTPDDPYEKQKEDFLKLLDYYQSLNFNAVIVQVRTAGDAFYPSNLAPWSKYLTGKEGKKPDTNEDPLSWMIWQAHQRGMEFHAWLNPYRATFDLKTELLSPDHDFNKHPQWMLKYGPKYYYDPGIPEVKAHLTKVIREVVSNYDVDAIHFDDYFYPYKIPNTAFPDKRSFEKYKKAGQGIEDWRRENVNDLVRMVHSAIKEIKPWVQFGISPFGVWRNQDKDPMGSPTQAGQTNYDDLYADPITWMKQGWIDYLIPQIYWSMDYELASYRKLNDWWSNNNYNTKIYVGNGPYKIRENADKSWDNPREINTQISYTRTLPNIHGNAFFSAKSLFAKNKDVANLLKSELYDEPTLAPDFKRTNNTIIEAPSISSVSNEKEWTRINLEKPLDPAIRLAVVQWAASLEELEGAEQHKVWVGTGRPRALEVSNTGEKYLAIRWIDHFGQIASSQVFLVP